jgi:hypothetical protein
MTFTRVFGWSSFDETGVWGWDDWACRGQIMPVVRPFPRIGENLGNRPTMEEDWYERLSTPKLHRNSGNWMSADQGQESSTRQLNFLRLSMCVLIDIDQRGRNVESASLMGLLPDVSLLIRLLDLILALEFCLFSLKFWADCPIAIQWVVTEIRRTCRNVLRQESHAENCEDHDRPENCNQRTTYDCVPVHNCIPWLKCAAWQSFTHLGAQAGERNKRRGSPKLLAIQIINCWMHTSKTMKHARRSLIPIWLRGIFRSIWDETECKCRENRSSPFAKPVQEGILLPTCPTFQRAVGLWEFLRSARFIQLFSLKNRLQNATFMSNSRQVTWNALHAFWTTSVLHFRVHHRLRIPASGAAPSWKTAHQVTQ